MDVVDRLETVAAYIRTLDPETYIVGASSIHAIDSAKAEIARLRSELDAAKEALVYVRNELAALVPVPSAESPEWPEFFSDADLACLSNALRRARTALHGGGK